MTFRGLLARYAIPVAALVIAAAGVVECLRLGIGDLSEPQPGLWPLIICCLIAVAAILTLLERASDDRDQVVGGIGKVVALALGLCGFVIVFQLLGVIAASALLVLLCLRLVARESWRLSSIVAGATALGVWLVFGLLLGVDLTGFLGA